jgi:hypothetical protein
VAKEDEMAAVGTDIEAMLDCDVSLAAFHETEAVVALLRGIEAVAMMASRETVAVNLFPRRNCDE